MLSRAATDIEGHAVHVRDPKSDDRTQVSVIDISRPYFNARVSEDNPVYVELPAGDPGRDRGMCGKVLVHMYGTASSKRAAYRVLRVPLV